MEWALYRSVLQAVVAHFQAVTGHRPPGDPSECQAAHVPLFVSGSDSLQCGGTLSPVGGVQSSIHLSPHSSDVQHSAEAEGMDMIPVLIAPWRLKQSWFPDVLELSIYHPV